MNKWFVTVQRAIYGIRGAGFNNHLIFNKDRVRLIGYSPKERRADNDND